VLQTEGEDIINLFGNIILTRVHSFAPNFPLTQIFERSSDDMARRVAEETSQAVVAGVVSELLQGITRRVSGV
jgi:hypothetical protein